MAAILAAAAASATTGLFGKSSSLSAYNVHAGPANTAPGSTSSSSHPKPFTVGLWKLISATHRTTGTDVTVWTFEKRFIDRLNPAGKEQVISALKKEASSLSRFRHPTLLNIVEPLEETRGELTWVSEAVTSSLASILNEAEKVAMERRGSGGGSGGMMMLGLSIDEVEIQKGILQVTQALAFLHKAKLVHLNINPEAILINSKGDWKLSGLTHATPLLTPEGHTTKYTFPDLLPSLPPQIQWKLDYLDPVYALDSQLSPTNDLYAVGCVLYALHMGGRPPWRNEGRIGSLRKHAEEELKDPNASWRTGRRWDSASGETRDLISRLITRTPNNRISEASLPQHPYFRSLAVSILNYLEPTTFSSKSREEKSTFLQGLSKQIPSFSERLRTKKILPSLIEQTRDTGLLALLIPAITDIARTLPNEEFAGGVLRPMAGLFGLKDPPQALLALLDLVPIAQTEATRSDFQSSMMPLIYNALESEHPPVQEKALQIIPKTIDSLDVSVLQDILLVKIAILFSKTKLLAVKVGSLECFLTLVPSLDKSFLTTKLVPLLARIKTKEPTVVLATLRLHEAMGMKVDYTAVATLILPQLWTMSTAPTLSLEQYQFFLRRVNIIYAESAGICLTFDSSTRRVIKSLGDRVEREHTAHLRAAGQTNVSAATTPLTDNWAPSDTSDMTFEKLLNGGGGPSSSQSTASNGLENMLAPGMRTMRIDDPWESVASNSGTSFDSAGPLPLFAQSSSSATQRTTPDIMSTSLRPARPLAMSNPPLNTQPHFPSYAAAPSQTSQLATNRPNYNGSAYPATGNASNGFTDRTVAPQPPSQSAVPSFRPASTLPPFAQSSPMVPFSGMPASATQARPMSALQPTPAAPSGWNSTSASSMGLMQPMRPAVKQGPPPSMKDMDWSDFDPLK